MPSDIKATQIKTEIAEMVAYEDFQERIARAKEAARLASLAAVGRGPPPPPPPPQHHHHDPRLPSPTIHLQPPPPAFFHQAPPPGVLGHAPHPPLPPPPHIQAAQAQTQAQTQAHSALPDDVRHRIDRLVEFIQRNGVAFEDTVRQREHDNPHFEFLNPGAHFYDYFVWKKRQVCGSGGAPPPPPLPPPSPFAAAAGGARGPPLFTPVPSPALRPPMAAAPHAPPPTLSADVLLSSMSAGALANVCKLARKNGLAPYTPIPQEMLWNTAALPPVEPARLEIRIAEFYRQSASSAKRTAPLLCPPTSHTT